MTNEEHKEFSSSASKNIRGRFIIQEIQDPIQEEAKLKSSIATTDSGRRLNKSKSQSKFRTNSKPNALGITNKKFDIFIYEIYLNSYINADIVLYNIKADKKIKKAIFSSKLSNILGDLEDTQGSSSNQHQHFSLLKHESLNEFVKKIRKTSYDFLSYNLQTIVMSQSIQMNHIKTHHSSCKFPETPLVVNRGEGMDLLYKNEQKINELLIAFTGYEYSILKEIQVNSFSIYSYSIYHCSFNL